MDAGATGIGGQVLHGLWVNLGVAGLFTMLLVAKSIADFTRTGPQVRAEILAHFRAYTIYAVARLAFWALVISTGLAGIGSLVYGSLTVLLDWDHAWPVQAVAALASLVAVTALQFCHHLLHIPSSIAASTQYRLSRFYPLWRRLSPQGLERARRWLVILVVAPNLASAAVLATDGLWGWALAQAVLLAGLAAVLWRALRRPGLAPPGRRPPQDPARPNVLMIGCDTLRADRLGVLGYHRAVTPAIDRLARRGTLFSSCYVPLARTAPSLATLLTGTWPHHHGIRSNYVADHEVRLNVPTLPRILGRHGYATAAVSDWAGADLGKLDFGFDSTDTPPDQWNLKYYLRQGPMDLRLFLSLFTHNRFGKAALPEIYYLAGVPLTSQLGDRTCELINRFSERGEPFLLNVFMGATHVPFGCEHPYYMLFSEPRYEGESKFVMSKFADPLEIIQKQEADRSRFDVEQIINLYDACVRRFDDEVARIVDHLHRCNLADNSIVVIYSDHGCDFFENNTWGQGNTVLGSDPSARVPMLIADLRAKGSGEIPQIARTTDVMPTLLELLGIPVPDGIDGVSLMPCLLNPDAKLDLPAFQETGVWLGKIPSLHPEHLQYPQLLDLLEVRNKDTGTLSIKDEYIDVIIEAKDRMVRTDRWKLVYQPQITGARYLLFDIVTDPTCTSDLAAEHPVVVGTLKQLLIEWMLQDPHRRWNGAHLVTARRLAHGEPAQTA